MHKGFDFNYVNFNNFSFELTYYYIDINGIDVNLYVFIREIFNEYKNFLYIVDNNYCKERIDLIKYYNFL